MKFYILLNTLLVFFIMGCDRRTDQAGATGSGAGIHDEEVREVNPDTGKEEKSMRQDAGGEDMNITTPIDQRPKLEE